MAKGTTFNAGHLYGSKSQVREAFREFWKGILIRDGRVGIIHAYEGLARRVHYSDALDTKTMTLTYIGEGRKGDQTLTRGNQALVDAQKTGAPVEVFFDCGDIQLPIGGKSKKPEKHLLAGGAWRVMDVAYRHVAAEGRSVYLFTLVPAHADIHTTLSTLFLGASTNFEEVLSRFATVRTELYEGYRHILHARDSIAGHVGEYFAMKGFNAHYPARPLVRVRSNFADLDAIQTSSGHRYAVKTVTSAIQKTSNIWTPLKDLPRVIDGFLVVDLDPWKLEPNGLFFLPVRKAARFWSRDTYQGSGKLKIDQEFRDAAERI
jgi:hypothetical protein